MSYIGLFGGARNREVRIEEAFKRRDGPRTHVPGVEVSGDELRSFYEQAVLRGP